MKNKHLSLIAESIFTICSLLDLKHIRDWSQNHTCHRDMAARSSGQTYKALWRLVVTCTLWWALKSNKMAQLKHIRTVSYRTLFHCFNWWINGPVRFHRHFNNISVISSRKKCTDKKSCLRKKNPLPARFETGPLACRLVLTHWAPELPLY